MTNKNEITKVEEKNIADNILNKVNLMRREGSLEVPSNYSPSNALKSAYLQLLGTKTGKESGYKSVLDVCTTNSISTTLLDMVTKGLNPAKNQCYFIAYGKNLQLQESYLGTVSRLKRVDGIKDVKAHAVYENDTLERELDLISGDMKIKKFTPDVKNRGKLIGALALIIGDKGILHTEYMDMEQIRKAWNQGPMKGNSPAHKNFPDQMAMKTVINRASKMYANTSDDSDIFEELRSVAVEVEEEIEEKANKEMLDFEEEEIIEEKEIEADEETGEIIEDVQEIEF